MNIAAWNLNHRATRRPVTDRHIEAILGIGADVLFLSEYVAGKDHDDLTGALRSAGLIHLSLTERHSGQNQCLCASRHSFEPAKGWECDLFPSKVNHTPIYLEDQKLTIVGHRVPEPAIPGHWDWLTETMLSSDHRRTLILGDLNADPNRPKLAKKDRAMKNLIANGWVHLQVSTSWSFRSTSGNTSLIDHALVTPDLTATVELLETVGEVRLVGSDGLSDHKPLLVKLG